MSEFKGTVTTSLEEYRRLARIEKALIAFSKDFNHLTKIDYFDNDDDEEKIVATVANTFSSVEEYVEKLNGIYIKHLETVLPNVTVRPLPLGMGSMSM